MIRTGRWNLTTIDYLCTVYQRWLGWDRYTTLAHINRCDEQYPDRWIWVGRAVR